MLKSRRSSLVFQTTTPNYLCVFSAELNLAQGNEQEWSRTCHAHWILLHPLFCRPLRLTHAPAGVFLTVFYALDIWHHPKHAGTINIWHHPNLLRQSDTPANKFNCVVPISCNQLSFLYTHGHLSFGCKVCKK